MREFTSAASRSDAIDAEPLEFAINGTPLLATPPTSGQLTYFMAKQATGDPGEIAKAMLELLLAVLGDEDYVWFENELRVGNIDIEMVQEVIEWLSEEWTDRPTTSASDSSPSRADTGKRSTANKRSTAKTRSTSK